MPMDEEKVHRLLEAIDAAAQAPPIRWRKAKLVDGVLVMQGHDPVPEQDRLHRLIYQDDWVTGDYDPTADGEWRRRDDVLNRLDVAGVRRALTWFVRGERFCEGHINDVIHSGRLVRLAERIRQLLEEGAFAGGEDDGAQ